MIPKKHLSVTKIFVPSRREFFPMRPKIRYMICIYKDGQSDKLVKDLGYYLPELNS